MNPQGGTAIRILSKSDIPKANIEFLQGAKVVSTMTVDIKAGLNSFQWSMRGPAPAVNPNVRRNLGPIPEMVPSDPNAPPVPAGTVPEQPTEVPFVAAGGFGGGGGGGGGGFRRAPQGALLDPGTYMIRLTAGGQTLTSSVDVLEDQWLSQQ